jgi:putative SOS response-associated peptidase YedK
LFAFLTTEPNALVAQYHPKAMPVIPTAPGEIDAWLNAPTPVALELQRPLQDDALVVAGGSKQDP